MMRVVAGLLNKQIGAELGTSETTIKIHRHQGEQFLAKIPTADNAIVPALPFPWFDSSDSAERKSVSPKSRTDRRSTVFDP